MDNKKSSRLPGFFNLSAKEKLDVLKDFAGLSEHEVEIIGKSVPDSGLREGMSENVVGSYSLPYSVAVNFLINGKDYIVPMVTEEPSVVAAACYGAKLLRSNNGIKAESSGDVMTGQIYMADLKDVLKAKEEILEKKQEIIEFANKQKPDLMSFGGGVRNIEVDIIGNTDAGKILRVHLLVDVKDAMGANTVDTIAEKTAAFVEKIVGSKSLLKIISNLSDKRLVKVKGVVRKESLARESLRGGEVVERIVKAGIVAENDIYRAVTNNKGILNGMGAAVLAVNNDWRALEAGAHGYAAKSGRYMPLTKWRKNNAGDLVGEMTAPVAVGIVGKVVQNHPMAKISLKVLGVGTAQELAQVTASVGLAQNLAALRALVSEGMQEGHMRLHNRNIDK